MMRQRHRRQDDNWQSRDPDTWWAGGEYDDNGKYTRRCEGRRRCLNASGTSSSSGGSDGEAAPAVRMPPLS